MSQHTKLLISKNLSRASSKSKESAHAEMIMSQINYDKMKSQVNARKQQLNSSKLSNGQSTRSYPKESLNLKLSQFTQRSNSNKDNK